MKKNILTFTLLVLVSFIGFSQAKKKKAFQTGGNYWDKKFEVPGWDKLADKGIPEWLIDAKFGIYTHWGVYSVAGHGGPDYVNELYAAKDEYDKKGVKKYHRENYGAIKDFGYTDLVNEFKAPAFDADHWADVMQSSGAKFGGICVVHHDGFCLWDSKATRWNAKNMGPKKDIYGEIAKSLRKKNMKLIATFHHARTFGYAFDKKHYNEYTKEQKETWDLFDPQYKDFFRDDNVEDQSSFGNEWFQKVNEVVDQYSPDVLWFDGLSGAILKGMLPQKRVVKTFTDFYNKNENNVICNKLPGSGIWNFPKNVGIRCYEGGRDMEPNPKGYWMIDRAISYPWSWVNNKKYRDQESFHIRTIIDVVSRGGVYLLSLTPKGDGSISDTEIKIMKEIGVWMNTNGEAIFETRKWRSFGHGEAKIVKEKKAKKLVYWDYRAIQDKEVRFTRKKDNSAVYAIATGWNEKLLLPEITEDNPLASKGIKEIKMLGLNEKIKWEMTPEGLLIDYPSKKVGDFAYTFKIIPNGKLINYDRE